MYLLKLAYDAYSPLRPVETIDEFRMILCESGSAEEVSEAMIRICQMINCVRNLLNNQSREHTNMISRKRWISLLKKLH